MPQGVQCKIVTFTLSQGTSRTTSRCRWMACRLQSMHGHEPISAVQQVLDSNALNQRALAIVGQFFCPENQSLADSTTENLALSLPVTIVPVLRVPCCQASTANSSKARFVQDIHMKTHTVLILQCSKCYSEAPTMHTQNQAHKRVA